MHVAHHPTAGRGFEPRFLYLHRGIARRAFERRFSLADHMKVTTANIDNGMLHVDLVHEVPEAAKPRTIKIGTSVEPRPQVTEQKAA